MPGVRSLAPCRSDHDKIRRMRRLLPLTCFLLALTSLAQHTNRVSPPSRWIGTWAAAPVRLEGERAQPLPIGKEEVTLRQVVHISQGGKRMRLVLTNEFGSTPLTISAAHVALLAAGSKILPATDQTLTFDGKDSTTIPAGRTAASDPVSMVLPIFSDLVISLQVPAQALDGITVHPEALTTTFIAQGAQTAAVEFVKPSAITPGSATPDLAAPIEGSSEIPGSSKPIVAPARPARQTTEVQGPAGRVMQTTSWYFLKGVEVDGSRKSAAVIAFGASITDGARSTPETNRRYPDVLATRFAAQKKTGALAVLNEGLGGNRLLHDGYGPSGLSRFDRDVLGQSGAHFVILLLGGNDIGETHLGHDPVTAEQVIDGLTELARRAHARGMRVLGATLTPFTGASYSSPEGESMRQQVNSFIRSAAIFEGAIDFASAVAAPNDPSRLARKYDSGDHLHPNHDGYAAMAAAVNLKLFHKR